MTIGCESLVALTSTSINLIKSNNMKLSRTLWIGYKIIYYFILTCLLGICASYFLEFLSACIVYGPTETCNLCIKALRLLAKDSGMTYEEINIGLFIIHEPLVILLLLIISIVSLHTNNKTIKEILKIILLLILIKGAACLFILGSYLLKVL